MCVLLPLGNERDPRIALLTQRFIRLLRRSNISSKHSLRSVQSTRPRADCTLGERVHCQVRNVSANAAHIDPLTLDFAT